MTASNGTSSASIGNIGSKSIDVRMLEKANPWIAVLVAIHKALEWSYEREWRIVAPLGDDAPGREWVMPTPTRLLLGSRMSPENRERILAVAREQVITVHEMVLSGDAFKLGSRPIVDAQ